MKVFGYIRVSGVSQLDGGGPERQQEAIMAFCAANKLELVNVFTEAISGTVENEDRPIFTQLLDCALSASVEAIVIEKMDRLARKVFVSEQLCATCREHQLALFAADRGAIDWASNDIPGEVLMRQIFAAFSEYDRALIIKRMESGFALAKREKGKNRGNKPYGKTTEEQAILARIKELRAQDPPQSFGKVATELNVTGFRNRKGSLWTPQQIHAMLRNADNRAPAL